MLTREEESRLVLLAKSGSEEAICRLQERFQPIISAAVSKYTRGFSHEQTEQDLESEAKLAFIESVKDFDASRNTRFATLLRLALRRRIIDEIRRLNRYDSRVLPEPETEQGNGSEVGSDKETEDFDRADQLDRLREVMKKLPEKDQTLLRLRFIENKTREEIIASGLTSCQSLDQVSVATTGLLHILRKELAK